MWHDDGFYDLQSSENEITTNFYWTDYLGDIDYVRILESRARKYFKEYGAIRLEVEVVYQ